MINNQETNIIWIDAIQNEENIHYKEELINLGYQKVNFFNQVNESIACIKGLFFERTKIIINSHLFAEFVNMFKNEIKSFKIELFKAIFPSLLNCN